MYFINKFLERITRFCRYLMTDKYKLNHKYHNKNQIVNTNFILKSLQNKNFNPNYIVDVGCGHGEWTKKMMKFFENSNFVLFDANEDNKKKLDQLVIENKNIMYHITLLSNDNKNYEFFKMGYGSSIYEEQTTHKREVKKIKSQRLVDVLPSDLKKSNNNMIKLDVQGSELKILQGLDDLIDKFETRKVVFNAKDTRPVMKDAILHAVEFEYLWLVSKRRYYGNVHAEDEKRIPMIEERMKAENHPLPTF